MHHHNQYHSHYPAESRLETQLTETKCHLVEPNINCSIHFDHLITFLQKVGRHESSVPVLLSIVSMQHNMHITPEFNTAKNRLIFLLMCRSNTGTNNSYRYFIGLWQKSTVVSISIQVIAKLVLDASKTVTDIFQALPHNRLVCLLLSYLLHFMPQLQYPLSRKSDFFAILLLFCLFSYVEASKMAV